MQHSKAPHSTAQGYLPIESYGMIGDLHTVALVGTNGSIDWCCLPSFDAPSVFGALLDAEKGGAFALLPPTSPAPIRNKCICPRPISS